MQPIISITNLSKIYDNGLQALKNVNLDIRRGEIFALLGPNGAGKTTLIGAVCGLVNPTAGSIVAGGYDVISHYRAARALIGLVPQEVRGDPFETVFNSVRFTRGLFGKRRDDAYVEKVLRDLSLWDKKDAEIRTLSGGMKRRTLIAKAMAHSPEILFLDEPTAGVDVELRRDMWRIVSGLREAGVTVILTTHYIEEAEEMADRVGVILNGEIILVEEKSKLIRQLGHKELTIYLQQPLERLPDALADRGLVLSKDGSALVYRYDTHAERTGITGILSLLNANEIRFKDISTRQSTLEQIFVDLVRRKG